MKKMWLVLLLVMAFVVVGAASAAEGKASWLITQAPDRTPVPSDRINALDQQSDCTNAGYNGSASSLIWQQEVKTGVAGQLTSFDLNFNSPGTVHLWINVGAPWQYDANDFDTTITVSTLGWVNIDTSAANIVMGAEQSFVIGVQGNDTGAGLCGNAFPGLYSRGQLWLNEAAFDGGENWDFAFRTYMGEGTASTMHIGDLDGGSRNARTRWFGGTFVTAHDQNHAPLAGVAITFDFPGSGSHTCTTDATGKCRVLTLAADSVPSLTFTVTGAVKSGYTYDAGANHDPDGDSNGTSITVNQP